MLIRRGREKDVELMEDGGLNHDNLQAFVSRGMNVGEFSSLLLKGPGGRLTPGRGDIAAAVKEMKNFLAGLAGYGMIGRVHGMNYGELPFIYPGIIPRPVLHTVCTSSTATAEVAAVEGGFGAWTTRIDEMASNTDPPW